MKSFKDFLVIIGWSSLVVAVHLSSFGMYVFIALICGLVALSVVANRGI